MSSKKMSLVSTIAHEMVHLMGLPDIYNGVSLNPNGTMADSLMDGMSSRLSVETGLVTCDIPGVMKYFFGWIDDVVQIYENEQSL